MDQKPRSGNRSPQTLAPASSVTCQILAGQMSPSNVSPSTTNYVLTTSNMRPVTNYALVAGGTQVPVTHQYVVQSTARTTVPQYVSTNNVRHILATTGGSQSSNVTYMLPSGAHIVRMNNVITTTVAGEHRPSAQFILTSSSQKSNPTNILPLASQTSKTGNVNVVENNVTSNGVSRNLGITTSTPQIIQRSGINVPKNNTSYYGQNKGNETPKMAFKPSKLSEQKAGTSFIITSNDWSRSKNSTLQKLNTNYMQVPLIQKSGTVLSTNNSVDIQPQKSQQQTVRSVILPSNYRTATVSPQQGTDCKLVLNSINVSTQVLNSNDNRTSTSNSSVSNIQQLNTNYMQIPISQKPGTIITRGNSQPSVGQQNPTIRSVILPSNYRTAMVSTPRKGVDYRLILKPVLRNAPPPRYTSPRNTSVRNSTSRQTTPSIRPNVVSPRVPLTRPSAASRIQNEIIANSKITPIPLRERESQLIISEKSIQVCIDEINNKCTEDGQPKLNLTEPALKLVQVEVTYRLFYLLRECKKLLMKSRSNVLSEEAVRQVCAEYFTTFYGNKLWPLFCLKPNDDDSIDEDKVWMRKHNNVNLVGWLKHPKFRNPSYIRKRQTKNRSLPLNELMKVSEVVYEYSRPCRIITKSGELSEASTTVLLKSIKKKHLQLSSVLSNDINCDSNHTDLYTPTLHSFLNIAPKNQLPSTSKQTSSVSS